MSQISSLNLNKMKLSLIVLTLTVSMATVLGDKYNILTDLSKDMELNDVLESIMESVKMEEAKQQATG